MANYDYSGLTWIDFQDLVQSLLQEELGISLEAFPPGKDGGVDLRCSRELSGTIIVQCKHFLGSGYPALIRSLKTEEPKVQRLKPARYIIATTVPLTSHNKEQIMRMFQPYIQNPQDIYGANDINSLLDKLAHIAQKSIKLYLSNWPILSRAINHELHYSAEILLREARDKVKLYFASNSHDYAKEILERDHVCLVSGPPGLGKTTLAEMLLLQYHQEGWEPYLITSNIAELGRIIDDSRKQIFLYDDFLGQVSSSEKLGKNEDAALARFVKQIIKSTNKRLILTTREYLLQDAQLEHETLLRLNLEQRKCLIGFHSYSDIAKASILYNHLYHSKLSVEHIRHMGDYGLLSDIIFHEGFSPRLIESIIEIACARKFNPNQFAEFFIENLNNPAEVWRHTFIKHVSSVTQSLLILLALFNESVSLNDLKSQYQALLDDKPLDSITPFVVTCRIIEKTFIRIDESHGANTIRLANPSLRGFLICYFADNEEHWRLVLRKAIFFEQLEMIWKLSTDGSASGRHYAPLLRRMISITCKKEYLSSLRAAVEATPQEQLHKYHKKDGSNSEQHFVLDERLVTYFRILEDLGESVDKEWSRAMLDKICGGWKAGIASRVLCTDIISLAQRHDIMLRDELQSLIDVARDHLLAADFLDSEDFDVVVRFWRLAPNSFMDCDLHPIGDAFRDWLVADGYPALRTEEPDVLAEIIEWMKTVGAVFKVDLDTAILEFAEERISGYAASEHARELSEHGYRRIVVSRITSVEFGNKLSIMAKSLSTFPAPTESDHA